MRARALDPESEVTMLPVPVAFTKVTPWREVRLVAVRFAVVAVPPTVKFPDAERFVDETEARLDWLDTVSEFNEARPVVTIVAAWRLPVPVAFTKVMPWRDERPEETVSPLSSLAAP